jgi:ABC-type nitrate/sulfonate/bicarbonate transport system substrate-binding protein
VNRSAFLRDAAIGATALAATTTPARAQSSPKIRLAAVASETYAAPLYARECGAFTRAGLNVELTLFPTGGAGNIAMAGGALDVSANDPLQMTNPIAHGLPFQYFAGALLHVGDTPTTTLCVAKNGPIKTAKDLEGQAIAVPAVLNLASICTREWMDQQGADSTKARFVELPGVAMAPAILRGTIAAAMLSEPSATEYASDIRMLANAYNVLGNRFQLTAYYARREWLTANADLARRLAAALYDGARWSNSHHADSLDILVKYSHADPDKLNGIKRATYATGLDFALIKPVLDIGVKYNVIAKALPAGDIIAKLPS